MNLREWVAELECQGKPEASEFTVMALESGGLPMNVTGFEIDHETETVWLYVEDAE